VGQPRLDLLEGHGAAQAGQGPSLLAPGPGPAGVVERLLGQPPGFGVGPGWQEQDLRVAGQDHGPLGRRRLGRDQADRLPVGVEGGAVERQPQGSTEPLVQQAGPDRVAGRVDPAQGLPPQLGRARRLGGQDGRAGGPLQQADPVEPGQAGRPRHLRPQLQGPLELRWASPNA
jgi:hypothetical protein